MIEITDEQFEEAFNKAEQPVKALMYSSRISDSAAKLLGADVATVNPNSTVLPIGYYLLGLLSTDQAMTALDELGIKNSMVFLGEIKKSVFEKVELVEEIKEIERTLSQPETPLPTQEADGTNVYQTSQDAVLNQTTKNDATRWGQV